MDDNAFIFLIVKLVKKTVICPSVNVFTKLRVGLINVDCILLNIE